MSTLVRLDSLALERATEPRFARLKWVEGTARTTAKILGTSKAGVELTLVGKLVSALRVIALELLQTTGLRERLATAPIAVAELSGYDPRLRDTFVDLAVDLDVVEREGDRIKLAAAYAQPFDLGAAALLEAVWSADPARWQAAQKQIAAHPNKASLADFVFIALLIEVKQTKQLDERKFDTFQISSHWGRRVKSEDYGAEMVDMFEYMLELLRVDLKQKFKFSKPESFFSELARRAFQRMMRDYFVRAGEEIVAQHGVKRILDVGCGYGDYVDACRDLPGVQQVIGVERQPDVAAACAARFADAPNVSILNVDVADASLQGSFDLVVLSFVLFYFPEPKKLALLKRLRELLGDGGVLLLCQYFPNIEGLQEQIAVKQRDFSLKRKMGMYFMTKILHAEALLNDTLTDFHAAERWESFVETLGQAGFKLEAVTNADELYYSFFFVATKDETASQVREAALA
jgi:SAM-dependent methyltransferase